MHTECCNVKVVGKMVAVRVVPFTPSFLEALGALKQLQNDLVVSDARKTAAKVARPTACESMHLLFQFRLR
jgi:hypothetical protein